MQYFELHSQEMHSPKKNAFIKIKNWIMEKLGINKQPFLPAGQADRIEKSMVSPPEEEKPLWDLSNWGMNIEDLVAVQDTLDKDSTDKNYMKDYKILEDKEERN